MIEIIIAGLLLIVGLALMVKGADFFVEGASSLALIFKIPPIVIGLTIVSLGTGAPELVVSSVSAFQGLNDLTLANVTGSNLFNTLVVLGVCASIYPIKVASNTVFKEIPFSFLAVFIFTLLGITGANNLEIIGIQNPDVVIGTINFAGGLIMLSMLVVFLYYIFGITKMKQKSKDNYAKEADDEFTKLPLWITAGYIAIGLGGLFAGGNLTVDNAIVLAQNLGLSEKVIGLTVISIGTSLPELVTSVTATLRKEFDLVVGNVVGSNILNIFLIIGISSIIKPLSFTNSHLFDNLFLGLITLILFGSMFLFKKFTLGKIEGVTLLTMYIMYTGYLFIG